jgi:prefoldin alpha subunit
MDKKKLQEKYVELQLLSLQIKQLEEQLSVIDQKCAELENLKGALHKLHKISPGSKSLVPLGQGIFVEGNINETDKILLNIGAGVMVKNTISEAEENITKQLEQLEGIILELSDNLKKYVAKAQAVEAEVANLTTSEHNES